MPKEHIRKRGKRKTKASDDAPLQPTTHVIEPEPSASTGIHPARAAMLAGQPIPAQAPSTIQDAQPEDNEGGEEAQNQWTRGPRVDSEFPFGILDPDVKAYFRSIEEQIKDWEGVSSAGEDREGMFLCRQPLNVRDVLMVSFSPQIAKISCPLSSLNFEGMSFQQRLTLKLPSSSNVLCLH